MSSLRSLVTIPDGAKGHANLTAGKAGPMPKTLEEYGLENAELKHMVSELSTQLAAAREVIQENQALKNGLMLVQSTMQHIRDSSSPGQVESQDRDRELEARTHALEQRNHDLTHDLVRTQVQVQQQGARWDELVSVLQIDGEECSPADVLDRARHMLSASSTRHEAIPGAPGSADMFFSLYLPTGEPTMVQGHGQGRGQM
jgi:chromosome segregation ATPase